ncbi:hypothetical protein FBZ93_1293 [Bradyrhizobium macuxiense]|uniref:Aspartate/glutamate racemase family protein n=1 Tax=Bradyrhizobium macuxiense TaxID=1755647 RepID=A0A560KS15_9BRAD|nr:hypothetical protein [Bradyrhizobium macuxiense]TWB86063.1 hypothetical protein FBZ93_1293 [Bradyrhizobium macuxiense]
MQSQHRYLGILSLERGPSPPKPRPGSIQDPDTFDFPTISETVTGAWPDRILPGDPTLEPACIAAARRLVERGAVAISSNCGFFIRHQAAVAAAVNVPVALSSVLLAPMLLRQLSRTAKLAVVTADSKLCDEDLLDIDDPADRTRIVIDGIEGGKYYQNEMKRPPLQTSVADIERDVVACVSRLRAVHPEIAAILFECTGLPSVAPAIRRLTGLPVYDITTLCRLTMASII